MKQASTMGMGMKMKIDMDMGMGMGAKTVRNRIVHRNWLVKP